MISIQLRHIVFHLDHSLIRTTQGAFTLLLTKKLDRPAIGRSGHLYEVDAWLTAKFETTLLDIAGCLEGLLRHDLALTVS